MIGNMETMTARAYLETTMFSFYYEERQDPEYQRRKTQARDAFAFLKAGKFELYSSSYTMQEIERTKSGKKRNDMVSLLTEYNITVLPESDEAERLAALYIKDGVVPESAPLDAAHIAMTTVNGLDFIVSLNFEHIVRPWAIERVRLVNIKAGYKPIGIYRPTEVLEL
jgi:hypothetical protein